MILNYWFQFIYLQKIVNLFSQFHLYLIFKKVICTYCIKRIYYKISIWQQKLFYLLLQKMNEFLQFYLQKYFNLFSFKKSDLYKLLKKYITLFAKEILIKKN